MTNTRKTTTVLMTPLWFFRMTGTFVALSSQILKMSAAITFEIVDIRYYPLSSLVGKLQDKIMQKRYWIIYNYSQND